MCAFACGGVTTEPPPTLPRCPHTLRHTCAAPQTSLGQRVRCPHNGGHRRPVAVLRSAPEGADNEGPHTFASMSDTATCPYPNSVSWRWSALVPIMPAIQWPPWVVEMSATRRAAAALAAAGVAGAPIASDTALAVCRPSPFVLPYTSACAKAALYCARSVASWRVYASASAVRPSAVANSTMRDTSPMSAAAEISADGGLGPWPPPCDVGGGHHSPSAARRAAGGEEDGRPCWWCGECTARACRLRPVLFPRGDHTATVARRCD